MANVIKRYLEGAIYNALDTLNQLTIQNGNLNFAVAKDAGGVARVFQIRSTPVASLPANIIARTLIFLPTNPPEENVRFTGENVTIDVPIVRTATDVMVNYITTAISNMKRTVEDLFVIYRMLENEKEYDPFANEMGTPALNQMTQFMTTADKTTLNLFVDFDVTRWLPGKDFLTKIIAVRKEELKDRNRATPIDDSIRTFQLNNLATLEDALIRNSTPPVQLIDAQMLLQQNTLQPGTLFQKNMAEMLRIRFVYHQEMIETRFLERVSNQLSLILFDDAHEVSIKNLFWELTLGDQQLANYFIQSVSPAQKEKFLKDINDIRSDFETASKNQSEQTVHSLVFTYKNKIIIRICQFFGLKKIGTLHNKLYDLMNTIMNTLTTDPYRKYTVQDGRPASLYDMFKVISDAFDSSRQNHDGVKRELVALRNSNYMTKTGFRFELRALQNELPPQPAPAAAAPVVNPFGD